MEKVQRDSEESLIEFQCSGLGVCEKPSLLLYRVFLGRGERKQRNNSRVSQHVVEGSSWKVPNGLRVS